MGAAGAAKRGRGCSVSAAAATLQRAGLIRYTRGIVTIPDRKALETAACSCYGVIRTEFYGLLKLS
jgi:hypothetical protein